MSNPTNKHNTPVTQRYCARSQEDYLASSLDNTLTTSESLGKADYRGIVVGIVLSSTEVTPNSIVVNGLRIATDQDFTPSSVPYAYVVNIPEKEWV